MLSDTNTKENKITNISDNINKTKEENSDKKAINSNINNPDKNYISDIKCISGIKKGNQESNLMKNNNINNLDKNKNNPNFNNTQNVNKVDDVINKKDMPKILENQKNNYIIEIKKYRSCDNLININKNNK